MIPVTNTSVQKERTARRGRMLAVLREAEHRYRNELMDVEERDVLRSRIVSLKTRLAATA
jgi:hypothetical protein